MALCDACTRRSSTGTLAGCLLLLMLWSFEQFDIGWPRLHSYESNEEAMYHLDDDGHFDAIDRPTMGSIWTKRDPTWVTGTRCLTYPAFVTAFDQLIPDWVRWNP